MNKEQIENPQTWESVIKLVNVKKPQNARELILENYGDQVTVAFVGEPFAFESVWEELDGWVEFDEQHPLHKGVEPALRIRINVIVVNLNGMIINNRVAYWEMDSEFFRELCKLRNKYGLEDWLYTIEKLDEDLIEPQYSLLMYLAISKEQKQQFENLPRINLELLTEEVKY